ncbi:MAG: hypothetical protein K2V38_01275, partial [Gemmataceae bacterium]|nr:hypothetical protein [Gemmataceae bacterium]
ATTDDERLLGGLGCSCCPDWSGEYECRVTTGGGSLDGVRSGVREPYWVAAQVLLYAREIASWKAEPDAREAAKRAEGIAQHELWTELTGPQPANSLWPRWRTSDVRALARHINAEQAFDLLPILADALQDAGCNDEAVLWHCRRPGGHAKGCWVVDLARCE